MAADASEHALLSHYGLTDTLLAIVTSREMHRRLWAFLGCAASFACGGGLRAQGDGTQSLAPLTLHIAGDSTACNYEQARAPRTGWGQVLGEYFTSTVKVDNAAISGRSSKSFIDEGAWDAVRQRLAPGDYVFIQFGHNDEKPDEPRHTDARTTYKDYLLKYIDESNAAGAHPVLLTPVNRRKFEGGSLVLTHGDYPTAMRELAAASGTPIIDLTEKTKLLFEKLGEAGTLELFMNLEPGQSPNYPEGSADDTHFTRAGAEEVAKLVASGVAELHLPLEQALVR